jgi:hypothetical protein
MHFTNYSAILVAVILFSASTAALPIPAQDSLKPSLSPVAEQSERSSSRPKTENSHTTIDSSAQSLTPPPPPQQQAGAPHHSGTSISSSVQGPTPPRPASPHAPAAQQPQHPPAAQSQTVDPASRPLPAEGRYAHPPPPLSERDRRAGLPPSPHRVAPQPVTPGTSTQPQRQQTQTTISGPVITPGSSFFHQNRNPLTKLADKGKEFVTNIKNKVKGTKGSKK